MSYEKRLDMFFEPEAQSPRYTSGRVYSPLQVAEPRIVDEQPQSQQTTAFTGTITDWSAPDPRRPSGTGFIQDHQGERFSFTGNDVDSGIPAKGRTVSFRSCCLGFSAWIPMASHIIVYPQQSQPESQPEPQPPELDERIIKRLVSESEPMQPRKILLEETPTQNGVIAFCDAEGGLINAGTGQYVFYLRDIRKGFAEKGCSVQFKAIPENPPRAVDVVIE